jgi:hypothetical protein
MRIAAVLLWLCFYASMGAVEQRNEARVEICMEAWASGEAGWQAKHIASEIYRKIGVKLIWKSHQCGQEAIRVSVERHTPDNLPKGALAQSWPFQHQRRMEVYWSSIEENYSPGMWKVMLGYTLAHEIGHILMETDGHSWEGVMKAHWDHNDLMEMAHGDLRFTERDRQAIVRGVTCLSSTSTPNRPCAPR